MASPSLSATLTFVKKYPITLCGFSLFFMPSVHRLLLYFTPLLLSTAIFIVAMMTWGPSVSLEKSTKRRAGKPKLMAEHHEWAFHEGIEMDDDEDEEEEDEEGNQSEEVDTKDTFIGKASQEGDTKVSLNGKANQDVHTQETTQEEPDSGVRRREELEPDPDLGAECGSAGVVSSGADCHEAEPDPDLQEGVGIYAEDDGDLHAVSDVYNRCRCADDEGDAGSHVETHEMGHDVHDKMGHVHDGDDMDHTHASHEMDHTHVDHTHDHHCHQHPKPRHAVSREHVQDNVNTGAEQVSYAIERLVQVSA